VRTGVVFVGLAILGAAPCLAAGLPSDLPTGACYISRVDWAVRYCRDNVIEKMCYQAASNFKMAGKCVSAAPDCAPVLWIVRTLKL
jgi:hypothetical protein